VNPSRIAIIVEGARAEPPISKSIKGCFFSGEEETGLEIIQFPFCGNIYNFYDLLPQEELTKEGVTSLSVDTIPLLQERVKNFCHNGNRRGLLPGFTNKDVDRLLSYKRNDFTQLFLFFDVELQDSHSDKNKIIQQLTTIFSNETESGKLYINYPMVEALRDIRKDGTCYQDCRLPVSDIPRYKEKVGARSGFTDVKKYGVETWRLFCTRAVQRVSCLFMEGCSLDEALNATPHLSFQDYRRLCPQDAIYLRQYKNHIDAKSEVMVLSSIPLFLLDYYPESFWKKMVEV